MNEIRLYIAEILLGLIVRIVPANTKDGRRLLAFIRDYLKGVVI